MTASPALVLFDMEGVLSHYDRSARVEHLSAVSGQAPDAVRHAIWGSGLEARADAGEISDDEYLSELSGLLGCPIHRDDWLAARHASITPYMEVLALAAKVADRCRIAVLTNNCRLVTDYIGYLNPPVAQLFGPRVCVRFVRSSEAGGANLPSLSRTAWRARGRDSFHRRHRHQRSRRDQCRPAWIQLRQRRSIGRRTQALAVALARAVRDPVISND
jgi:hypothetical protein